MPRWTTVKLPVNVAEKVREMIKREKKAGWQIILEGIECLERTKTKAYGKQNISELDRVSYYIMKLGISIERFKLNPTKENLLWLEKTVNQIKERLGVDVSYIYEVAKKYERTKDETERKELYVELNMMYKMGISDLIKKLLQE